MIGAVLNGRYRLEAELGQGGMGVVYQARDLLLDRDVAVKILSADRLGAEGRSRLLREARSAAQLNHPNIVSIHDAGEASVPGTADPVPFIVMELVAGPSLHESPPDGLAETLRLAGQICAALEHAHAHGIVHRDLKPENVLLAPGSAGGRATAKLSDFGLARSMVSRLTTEGTIAGTVFYLAPELAVGQEFDGRADLYALGVMLYELTTGELPFSAGDPVAVISQHLHAPPVPPRARPRGASLPAALDALILRLLNKSPQDRPGSAAAVGQVLARLAAGERLPAISTAEGQGLSVLDRIARGRLVAREEELSRVRALWQRAAAGEGQVLLVGGEPGVGKTRLMRELVTQVQVAGDRALVGECYAEGGAPYAPFGQIVQRALENDAGDRLSLPDFVLADLVALAPALRVRFPGVSPNPALDPRSEQQRLFESVVALCTALSARGPLLLVLEDGHWADSGSLALLRHLARRTRAQPVLVAVTYRDAELDQAVPFRDVLVDLNRERLATHLKLSRLDRGGTRRLLAALFAEEITPEFLDGIYHQTEGNPFFVEEVCKALVESGALTFAEGRWHRPTMDRVEVPQSVRLAIQSRVRRLPEEVRHVLHMAATLGREFGVDLLVEAMGRAGADEEVVSDALDAAARAQLVEEVGTSPARELSFSFMHALIPAVLADAVPALRRRRLHRHAAEAVERLHPDDDEALARHFAAAGDRVRALIYSTRAGDRAAAVYANAEAERHYQAALEMAGDSPQRAGLLGKLGVAQVAQGSYDEAFANWRQAIALFLATGDRDGAAALYALASFATWERGDAPGALALCREGLAAVAGAEMAATAGVARLLQETARTCVFNYLPEEAALLGRRALVLAEQLGAVDLQADVLITLGLLQGQTTEEAVALTRRAVELADAARLLPQAARAINNLAFFFEERLGDLAAARAHYLRAAELRRQTGAIVPELGTRADAATTAVRQGMLAVAEQEVLELRRLLAAVPDPGRAALDVSFTELGLRRYRGELAEAAALWEALRAEGISVGGLGGTVEVDEWPVEVEFERGNERQAEALAQEAIATSKQTRGKTVFMTALLSAHYAGHGELERARLLLSQAREEAAAWRLTSWEAVSLTRAEAHLAAAEGRWPAALEAFESLVGEYRRAGARWRVARTVREWAQALLARGGPGDREQAHSLLAEAATEFEAVGAPYYAEQARRRMNELDQG